MDCKYGIVEVKSQEKVIYPERNINYIIKNMEGTMRKRQLMTGKKLAALALAVLIEIIDVRQKKSWCTFIQYGSRE
jgi:hypothetical protein